MEFAGFGHVTLTVSNYDACLKFYDRLMTHIGMRRYFESPLGVGWFAGRVHVRHGSCGAGGRSIFAVAHGTASSFVLARAAATKWISCYAMLKEIGAKTFSLRSPVRSGPAYYSVAFEDPDGTRLEMNYIPHEGWAAAGARQTRSLKANRNRRDD